MPGGIVKIADVSDFISPSQACILPLPESNKKTESLVGIRKKNEPRPIKNDKISVSLKDCLACSGCITTAETVLIEEQNVTEMFERMANSKIVFVTIAPQSLCSIGAHFNWTAAETAIRLTNFFKQKGAHYVVDSSFARILSLDVLAEEFTKRNFENRTPEMVLSGVCPGFVCYAEKKKTDVLDRLSTVRSPQGISGSIVKDYLRRTMNWDVDDLYHVAVMPCYDKKLEASRPEYVVPETSLKEVDCVVTPTELQTFLQETEFALNSHVQSTNQIDWLKAFENGRVISDLPNEGSGGYTEHLVRLILDHFAAQNINVDTKREALLDLEYITLQPENGRSLMLMKAYGFRNIQNLMRKLRLKKLAPDFVEVMACPRGCLNGGGQIRNPDPQIQEAQLNRTTELYTQIETEGKSNFIDEARRLRAHWNEINPNYQNHFLAQFHAVSELLPNSVAALQW
ncbi:Iron only hydrogenase large subunit domain protein [Aphelenchoides besseyi]|nr:Iron only hydrogenase large subunit domain protein [Aphelenchoides besseyi]